MIRAIVFDLDNCLMAADEPGRELVAPALEAIRAANRSLLDDAALERAFADVWVHALDVVAEIHGFSAEMFEAGFAAFLTLEVTGPLHGYPDLPVLAELEVRRFLVTSGFRRLQESKIRALGIAPLFDRIVVDAIEDPARKGKQRIFRDLIDAFGITPSETLVVGDNPESELASGRRLGMPTVQILRPGVFRSDAADRHIGSLSELREPGFLTERSRMG